MSDKIIAGIESHKQRCDNGCLNKGCYFHPEMGTSDRGLDTNHVIPIPEFIRRFGCATYSREHDQQIRAQVLEDVRTKLSKLITAYPTGADFVWWLVIDTALNKLKKGD